MVDEQNNLYGPAYLGRTEQQSYDDLEEVKQEIEQLEDEQQEEQDDETEEEDEQQDTQRKTDPFGGRRGQIYTQEENELVYNRITEAKALGLEITPVYEQLAEQIGAPSGGAVYQVYRKVMRKKEKEAEKQREIPKPKSHKKQVKTEQEIPSLEEWRAQQKERDAKEAELLKQLQEAKKQTAVEAPAAQSQTQTAPQQMTFNVPNTNTASTTPTVSYYTNAGTTGGFTMPIYPNQTYGYLPTVSPELEHLRQVNNHLMMELDRARRTIQEMQGKLETIRYLTERGQ